MWRSWAKFHARDRARSGSEGKGRIGHNVAFGRPPQMPQFGENDPSSEIPRLAYCGTARPRRLGVPHPKAAVPTHSHPHLRRCPLAPRSLGAPAVSETPSFSFSLLSTESLTDWGLGTKGRGNLGFSNNSTRNGLLTAFCLLPTPYCPSLTVVRGRGRELRQGLARQAVQ
jgi:hypothetical protein